MHSYLVFFVICVSTWYCLRYGWASYISTRVSHSCQMSSHFGAPSFFFLVFGLFFYFYSRFFCKKGNRERHWTRHETYILITQCEKDDTHIVFHNIIYNFNNMYSSLSKYLIICRILNFFFFCLKSQLVFPYLQEISSVRLLPSINFILNFLCHSSFFI